MTDPTGWTRRRFVTRLALWVAAPLALRCGGAVGPSVAEIEAKAKSYDPDLECSDTKGLWPAELQARTENEYRDHSTQPGQFCFICSNYEKPKVAGTCGTCRSVKGPIHPLGWCKAWTELRG